MTISRRQRSGDSRSGGPVGSAGRSGRPPATSRAKIEQVALRLFDERGFDETSVDDIAALACISRRTLFRYYRSKLDIVWGDFDFELTRLHAWFDAVDSDVEMMQAVRAGVLESHRRSAGAEEVDHRRRMRLILGVPNLRADSTPRLAKWRAEVARFAAGRLGVPDDDLLPRVIGYSTLGAVLAAYEQWLGQDGSDLEQLLDTALSELAVGFRHTEPR